MQFLHKRRRRGERVRCVSVGGRREREREIAIQEERASGEEEREGKSWRRRGKEEAERQGGGSLLGENARGAKQCVCSAWRARPG